MKTIKSLADIAETEYIYFHSVLKPYNFILEAMVIDDYVELSENYYDIFDAGESVIVGFKSINNTPLPPEASPFVVRLTRDGGEQYLIDIEDFAKYLEVFGVIPPSDFSMYWLMDSVVVNQTYTKDTYSAIKATDRCDTKYPAYGPWRFEVRDGIKETLYDYEQMPRASWFNAVRITSVPGKGHIIKLTVKNAGSEWKNWPVTTVAATSLVEIMQMLRHWSFIAEVDPLNDERIVVKSKEFNTSLGLPSEVIDELDEMCPTTCVSEYFSGNPNSRVRSDSSFEAGPELKKYLLQKICFSSLSALAKHSVVPVTIPESILSEDRQNLAIQLMNFLNHNNINHSEKTPIEMLEHLRIQIKSGDWSDKERQYEKLLLKYIAIL